MRARMIFALFAYSTLMLLQPAFAAQPADETAEINKLVQQGHSGQALQHIEAYLANHPQDVKIRFLKGVLLAERGSTAAAINTFLLLTRDHPDVPEPYNNLAVLHASRGEYDKARIALESAIRLNPGYAIAYENLGDIHAKLASQAYEKSRELDKSNAVSQTKIEIIRGLFAREPGASGAAKKGEARRREAPKLAVLDSPKAEGSAGKTAETASKATTGSSSAAPVTAALAEKSTSDVISVLQRWADAWAKKDASAYLAFYAPDFKVPGNEPRARWEAARRARIDKPRRIEVVVSDPKVTLSAKDRATVTFQQHYRSEVLDERVMKTVVLAKNQDKWLIVEEQVLK